MSLGASLYDILGDKTLQDLRNKVGTATLVAGTVTVTAPYVSSTSKVMLSRQLLGGTPGHLSVSAIVDGTSFDIDSSSAMDTSDINYVILDL